MKILYVVTGAEYGGASRHVLVLMEYMKNQGHEVGLVSAREGRITREARKIGALLYPNPHFISRVCPHKDIRAVVHLYRSMREFKPDLVSSHSTKAGYAARICGAMLSSPVIFTAHGWAFTEGRSFWKRLCLSAVEGVASTVTSKIICVSEHDRDLALKFHIGRSDQLVVIHNGIDSKLFLEADGSEFRDSFDLDGKPVMTMVGRLVAQKDPLVLLEACSLVKAEFMLFLVGDGNLRDRIDRIIRDRPSLKGAVHLIGEREDIHRVLTASDIFVLSSRWEGLPRSVIEAMMAGLPVVASRVGGVAELVEHGRTGILVPPGDPVALAKALESLLRDVKLRKCMGAAGRKRALKQFNLDSMLCSTHRVYEEVLSIKNQISDPAVPPTPI